MQIINYQTSKVLIRNTSIETLRILCHHKLGYLIDITYDNCFFTNIQSGFDAATFTPLLYQLLGRNNKLTNPFLETVLDNEVKVYGDAATVR